MSSALPPPIPHIHVHVPLIDAVAQDFGEARLGAHAVIHSGAHALDQPCGGTVDEVPCEEGEGAGGHQDQGDEEAQGLVYEAVILGGVRIGREFLTCFGFGCGHGRERCKARNEDNHYKASRQRTSRHPLPGIY